MRVVTASALLTEGAQKRTGLENTRARGPRHRLPGTGRGQAVPGQRGTADGQRSAGEALSTGAKFVLRPPFLRRSLGQLHVGAFGGAEVTNAAEGPHMFRIKEQ